MASAVTQYIGARYVPKFYENSEGTAAWRSGVAYEPLTIVTYNGNSYTSKKPVPAEIGDPSSNPSYWVATGIYNEQISALTSRVEELSDEIEAVDSRIDAINDNEIVIIGDSWFDPVEGGAVLAPLVAGRLNVPMARIHNFAEGATGFIRDSGKDNFVTQTRMAVADTSINKNKVTHVICYGGVNDNGVSASVSDYVTAINTINSLVKANFPNSKLYVFFMQAIKNGPYLKDVIKAVINGTDANVINASWPISLNLYADNLHPTTEGYHEVARFIAANILGYEFKVRTVKSTFTDAFNTQFANTNLHAQDVNVCATWDENSVTVYGYFLFTNTPSVTTKPFGFVTIPSLGIPVLFAKGGANPLNMVATSTGVNTYMNVQVDGNTSIGFNANNITVSATSLSFNGSCSFVWG